MTNINQFLPFYIGCEVKYRNKRYLLEYASHFGEVCLDDDSGSKEMVNDSNGILPILRPLESMTEEHRKELWQLIFKGRFTMEFIGQTIWIDKESLESSKRWVMMSGVERLGIEMNGDVWADSDLHKWKFNPHEVTKFFTDRFYDVFFLHKEGLCLYRNDKGELY